MSELSKSFDNFSEEELQKVWVVLAELAPDVSSSAIYSAVDSRYRAVMEERMEREARVENLRRTIHSCVTAYMGGEFDELILNDQFADDYDNADQVAEDITNDLMIHLKPVLLGE